MNFKLIMALVSDEKTQTVIHAARDAGATGVTVVPSAQGEGLKPEKTFLGLDLSAQRDILLFLVAAPKAREILETIAHAAQFDEEPGAGVVCQIAIEDAIGLTTQLPTILSEIEDQV